MKTHLASSHTGYRSSLLRDHLRLLRVQVSVFGIRQTRPILYAPSSSPLLESL